MRTVAALAAAPADSRQRWTVRRTAVPVAGRTVSVAGRTVPVAGRTVPVASCRMGSVAAAAVPSTAVRRLAATTRTQNSCLRDWTAHLAYSDCSQAAAAVPVTQTCYNWAAGADAVAAVVVVVPARRMPAVLTAVAW